MKNIFQWKTTLIGVLSFLIGGAYLFVSDDANLWILVFLFAFGTGMLFSADTLISSFSDFIKGNKDRKI